MLFPDDFDVFGLGASTDPASGECGFDWQPPCSNGCASTYTLVHHNPCVESVQPGPAGVCVQGTTRAVHCADGSYWDLGPDGIFTRSGDQASCGHALELPCSSGCRTGMAPLSAPSLGYRGLPVGLCVEIGTRFASTIPGASCTVQADGGCLPSPPWTSDRVPLPLFKPGSTPPQCSLPSSVRVHTGGTTVEIDCKQQWKIDGCPSQTQRTPDWLLTCLGNMSCPSGSNFVSSVPFPPGSILTTSRGFTAIAIKATPEIKANYQLWVAEHKRLHDQGQDPYGRYQRVLDGTGSYGWPLLSIHNNEWNAYGKSPPDGAPTLVNPQDVKPGQYCSQFVYNEWGYYYGAQTAGWLLLINIPYANPDTINVIPWLTDPLETITAVVIEVVKAIVKEVVEVIGDVLAGLTAELKNLLCSLGPAGALASAAGGAYFGGKGGLTAATNAYNAICGQGVVCPPGYTKDATNGTCMPADNTLLYVGIGVGALLLIGLGFLAFKKPSGARSASGP